MELPECHSRRDFDAVAGRFFCAHPKVHSKGNIVSAGVCAICEKWKEPAPQNFRPLPTIAGSLRDRPCMFLGEETEQRVCKTCRGNVRVKVFACDHPNHEETTLRDCALCLDYERRQAVGDISSWAVGVTTAPRFEPTLRRSVESLVSTGWDNVRIFAEPEVEIPGEFAHLPVTWRESRVGAWPNWYLGLAELYMRHPGADAYMMVQDDTIFCRSVREYAEQTLWPGHRIGLASFYCPQPYGRRTAGFHEVDASLGLVGALTFVFPNAAVRCLLADIQIIAHRMQGGTAGVRNIDEVVGRWAHRRSLPVFYHYPSLAQHIGETSTVWSEAENRGKRHSTSFVGEDYDAMSISKAAESNTGKVSD